MVVPVADQAAQQVGPAQEGRVERSGRAEHEMVAAAGAGMAAVEHELFGREARQARRFVEVRGAFDELVPVGARLDVDLDDAGIGGDAELDEARIARRLVTFEDDRRAELLGRGLDGGGEFDVVFQRASRRHENVQDAVARLRRHGRARDPAGGLLALRPALEGRAGEKWGLTLGGRRYVGLPADFGVGPKRGEGLCRVGRIDVGVVGLGHPGLRIEWQAVADRRIAGNQVAALAAQEPRPALPAPVGGAARDRQHVPDDGIQPLRE